MEASCSVSCGFNVTSVRRRRPDPPQQTAGQIQGYSPGGTAKIGPDLWATPALHLELATPDTPPDPAPPPEPPEGEQEVMSYG